MEAITGSASTVLKKIFVNFYEGAQDDHGAISVRTCTTELLLPVGIFDKQNFEIFKIAMNSAIEYYDYNVL